MDGEAALGEVHCGYRSQLVWPCPPGEDPHGKFPYTLAVAAVIGEANRTFFGLKQLIYDVKLLTIFGKGMHYSFLFLAKAKTLNI